MQYCIPSQGTYHPFTLLDVPSRHVNSRHSTLRHIMSNRIIVMSCQITSYPDKSCHESYIPLRTVVCFVTSQHITCS